MLPLDDLAGLNLEVAVMEETLAQSPAPVPQGSLDALPLRRR